MRFQDSNPEAKQWSQQLTMTKCMHTLEAWSHHCLPQGARLQQIMEAQKEDPVCRQIKVYCCEGWPDKYSLNDAMKPYWSSRGELSVVQNILLKVSRIVIPSSMCLEILDNIHESHQKSLNVVNGPKTLFGGKDAAEKSRIWCNNVEFVLFKGTTNLNRLSRHPYLTVPDKSWPQTSLSWKVLTTLLL